MTKYLAVLALSAMTVAAQEEISWQPIDRVVAIVGDEAITYSALVEQLNIVRARGVELPAEGSAEMRELQADLLNSMIDDEILRQAAAADTSIAVTGREVQARVDADMRRRRQQISSEAAFEQELRQTGFNSELEYRTWLAERYRKELMIQRLIEARKFTGEIQVLEPTERELRDAFEEFQPQLGTRGERIWFRQIVITPQADSVSLVEARAEADSLLRLVRSGADFSELAIEHSDDPGSAQRGGDLGAFRRGRMYPAFERAAFGLRTGEVSDLVRTPVGFHIIRVDRKAPAEVSARHILVSPVTDAADLERARRLAGDLIEALSDGAPVDSLIRLYHDPLEQSLIEDFETDSLPEAYRVPLSDVASGDVVGPIEIDLGFGLPKIAVVLVQEVVDAGGYRFEDVRDELSQQMAEERARERYVETLRQATYVDVRL